MPVVIGIDPRSTGHQGIGVVDANSLEVLELQSVRVYDKDAGGLQRTWKERTRPVLDRVLEEHRLVTVLQEHPSPTIRQSQRGKFSRSTQGNVSLGLGRALGMVEAWCADRDIVCLDELSSEWRPPLARAVARSGFNPYAPRQQDARSCTALPPERVGGLWRVRYTGSDYVFVALDLAALQARPATPPAATTIKDAEDAPKRAACAVVADRAPVLYRALVDAARARARKRGQEDHDLPGVADACEGACIALSLVLRGLA